jgi:hypothetical protein
VKYVKQTSSQEPLERKIIKNFSQSEAFMAPGSHVGYPIVMKVTTLG